MSIPRQHHYLPEFYLRGFEENRTLWVYQKDFSRRRSTAGKEARQRDLYSFRDDSGQLNTTFEDWLGRIESTVAPLLPKIEARGFVASEGEREAMFWFVASMFTRVPAALRAGREVVGPAVERLLRKAAQTTETFEALIRAEAKEVPQDVNLEEVRLRVLEAGSLESQRTPEMELSAMFESARQVVDAIIGKFRMQFVHVKGEATWLLSDDPVLTFNKSGVGVGFSNPGTMILLPLSGKVAVLLGEDVISADADAGPAVVKGLNRFFIKSAHRAVYSGDGSPRLERAAKKHIGTFKRGENVHIPMWEGKFI